MIFPKCFNLGWYVTTNCIHLTPLVVFSLFTKLKLPQFIFNKLFSFKKPRFHLKFVVLEIILFLKYCTYPYGLAENNWVLSLFCVWGAQCRYWWQSIKFISTVVFNYLFDNVTMRLSKMSFLLDSYVNVRLGVKLSNFFINF